MRTIGTLPKMTAPITVDGTHAPRVEIHDPRTLLNTGPSPRGWHRLELALRCPRLYAYVYILKIKLPPALPLIRGTLRHVGLAHYYARLRAMQRGEDPEVFYAPREAIQRAAVAIDAEFHGDVASKLALTHADMPGEYATVHAPEEDGLEILEVEHVHEANVGGHRYTARFDLVLKDRNGRIWIYDHKGAARPDKRTVTSYSLSGQILGLQRFGAALYGNAFGGVRLNFISGDALPFKYLRETPAPAPAALAQFPATVRYAEARIAQIEACPNPWDVEAVFSDVVCVHRYGRCPGYDLCAWGDAGLPLLRLGEAE